MQIYNEYLQKKKYKYKSTCYIFYMYMYVCTKKTIHCPLHCIGNLVNIPEKCQKLRHFCIAHYVFFCNAIQNSWLITLCMCEVICPAIDRYGFYFAQNRSTAYCYTFLHYTSYSSCLFNHYFPISMKAHYYLMFLIQSTGK